MKEQKKPAPKAVSPMKTIKIAFNSPIDNSGKDETTEVASPVSPGEQEKEERTAERAIALKPSVDKYFPDVSTTEIYEYAAKKYKKTVEELTEDEKGGAEQALRGYIYEKNQLIKIIAESDIADSDFGEYMSIVYYTGKIIYTQISPRNLIGSATDYIPSLEEARLYKEIADEWKGKFLQGEEDPIITKRMLAKLNEIILDLSGSRIYPRPPIRPISEMKQLFDAYTEVFVLSQKQPAERGEVAGIFDSAAWQSGLSLHSPDQIKRVLEIYETTIETENIGALKIFADSVRSYSRRHVLGHDSVRGLVGKLLPAIEHKDENVDLLLRGGNIWGMKVGDFGVADFIFHSYASIVDPFHLNELLLAAREVPTTSVSKLEQNRKDGLALMTPFGILRDFIHDQRPYVHEVIKAMVQYYDTGDNSQLLTVIPKTDYFRSEENSRPLLDRIKYDQEVQYKGEKSTAILVLRRLLVNTEPFQDVPPRISDQEISEKVAEFYSNKLKREPLKQELGMIMEVINQDLEKKVAKADVGIEPNYILLISWVERRGFEMLQNLTYEDQVDAYKQDWFVSLLKFHELITSPNGFNEDEFNKFIAEVKEARTFEVAYKIIGRRVLGQISTLTEKYNKLGRKDVGALWSGNITHELLGLIDYKSPTTEQGKKSIREKERQRFEPGYHPGD